MTSLLDHNWFFVKEKVRFFKLSNLYEIYDQNQKKIGEVREKTNFLKKVIKKYELGFYDAGDNLLFKVKKPFAFIKQKFYLYDNNNMQIGYFYKKIVALIPQFFIFDNQDRQIALLKGDFFAWNFQVVDNNGANFVTINKIFSGALREMFTTADSYQIMIQNPKIDKRLIIAAPFVVDMTMKEGKSRRSFGGIQ